jgi:hypothetical protein
LLGRNLNLFESGTAIVGGLRILDGQTPYLDFFAFYGPLTYLIPGLAQAASGSVSTTDFVLSLVFAVSSSLVAYALTARISGRPIASLFAPLALVLLGATTPRTLAALVSVLLFTEFERTGKRLWAMAAGVAGGVALLWIQDSGAWICVAVAVLTIVGLFNKRSRALFGWKEFLLYAFGVAVALLPWAVYLAVRGAVFDWLYWSFVFPNSGYTQRSATAYFLDLVDRVLAATPLQGAYIGVFFVLPFVMVVVLAVANVVMASFLLLRRRAPVRTPTVFPVSTFLLAVYALLQLRVLLASVDEAKLIDSSAPTIICSVSLAIGLFGVRAAADRRVLAMRIGVLLVLVWLAVWPIWSQTRYLLLQLREQRPEASVAVGGLPFREAGPPVSSPEEVDELVDRIAAYGAKSDELLVLPTSPLIYAISGRHNPSRYDYLDPVYTTNEVDAELAQLVSNEEVGLLVLSDSKFPGTELRGADIAPKTYEAIASHYAVVEKLQSYTLLVPIGR